jgi:RHS repeat-associated protein
MLNPSYIVASALTPQVGSCTTNGNDPNLPFTNNRTNNGNHDAAGNVRWDGATTYAFDAENRITNSTRTVGSISTIVNYKYDGDGRRVRVEVTGGASTNFVYDAGGKLLAEYNSQNYPESGTRFRIGDHLGSTRLLFDLSGNILQRFDYLPFGEELLTSSRTTALKYGVASILKQRFTGQMRDAETNLDYFNARYLSPNQGRFMSADLPLVDQTEGRPQSWNLYGYARNNPLRLSDPSGRSCVYNDGDTNKTNPVGDNGDGYGCAGLNPNADSDTPSPTGPDGKPMPPPVKLPPGNGGEQNEWIYVPNQNPVPGQRPGRWKPKYPVPHPKGSQPSGSWDPEGHWDVDLPGPSGRPERKRFLPDGTPVGPDHQPIPQGSGRIRLDPERLRTGGKVVVVVGTGYLTYRIIRMLPSLFPPLWPTIPANAVIP